MSNEGPGRFFAVKVNPSPRRPSVALSRGHPLPRGECGTECGTLHPDDPCATLPLAMPRQPRLDAPGALHHVMGRGIENTKIFPTDSDRADIVDRLAGLC